MFNAGRRIQNNPLLLPDSFSLPGMFPPRPLAVTARRPMGSRCSRPAVCKQAAPLVWQYIIKENAL